MAMGQLDIMGNPITDDRKGSLTLRSDQMNYSRAVLNSHWHQARESEPKDYDLNKHPMRTMTYSTYDRIGNATDGTIPETTYQEHVSQCHLKPYFKDTESHKKSMVQLETLGVANAGIDRNTGDPKGAYGAVLPHHNKDYKKFHLDTTYNADFVPSYPLQEGDHKKTNPHDFEDKSAAYKKMKSQFTDPADYRRNGWNTWQDESGMYTNSQYKAQVFPKTITTLPPHPIPNYDSVLHRCM